MMLCTHHMPYMDAKLHCYISACWQCCTTSPPCCHSSQVNFQVPRDQKASLRDKFDRMFQAMSALPIKLPGTPYMRGIEARAEVIEDIKALLAAKRQQEQQNGSDVKHKANVLDTAMDSMKYLMGTETLTDDDIAASGVTLIIAGNDTSGLGIMGMLGLLALKPDVMAKLRREQEQVWAVTLVVIPL
eukprot:GHUV01043202.1.p1 GENE.GHUV01043202.1~~GHUV01043202.1.p1  ORF type:complete len:187 (+),score=54.87 GHUV01043202.1:414-974(+)